MSRIASIALLVLTLVSPGPKAEEVNLPVVRTDIAYGSDASQKLDVYYLTGKKKLPVIIYVHGGGWAFGDKADVGNKPQFFARQNIAFVSMDYRLRWDYDVLDQTEDIVSVIGWVHQNATQYGLDANKIILMGYAAGAHLVSLVGTNSSFLRAANRSLDELTAVIAVDTASYDIVRLMVELGSFIERRQHRLVFGNDEEVWRQASPITHVQKGKAIPAFALMYLADQEGSTLQAKGFAKALAGAGIETIIIPVNDGRVDERLGTKGDAPTQALLTFLRAKI
ncbi:MAG: alpha/beta hydrolase [Proteobacteria bacterium]|nr:alpha/beta hydrolase [Pseudomonadota bacterium]MDA1300011.1 alpha/beta hydrolase [Pseudomonadota bacterium]